MSWEKNNLDKLRPWKKSMVKVERQDQESYGNSVEELQIFVLNIWTISLFKIDRDGSYIQL